MNYWLIIICTLPLMACGNKALHQPPKRFNPALIKPVIDLIDNEAAVITVTRAMATQGTVHPLLAQAIEAENSLGQKQQGIYLPSSTERVLHRLLIASPYYALLDSLLDPEQDIEPSANASFSIDYSNYSKNTVNYGINNRRESHTYEIGLSFRLIDPEGKLAYERKFIHVARQICTYRVGGVCLEIRSKQKILPQQMFLKTLKIAYHNALLETTYGLHAWAEVIRHLRAVVSVYHSSGKLLKTQQPAVWLRKKKQAEYRYLYISLPSFRVNLDRLFKNLEKRGELLTAIDKRQLENFVTTSIRSNLDQYLQARLQQSREFKHAGIFLLPDPDAIWFKDALSLVRSQYLNRTGDSMEITEQGIKYNESLAFGDLCSAHDNRPENDVCLAINVRYYDSSTETPVTQKDIVEARQTSTITGLLLDPKIKDKQRRYFPRLKNPTDALVYGVGSSDSYIKIKSQGAYNNEDRIYLRAATQKAAEDLAEQMVENIILSFQQTITK